MTETTTTGTTTSAQLTTSVTPDLTVIDGVIYTTSLQVAQHFVKRHTDVLKAIRNLLKDLPKGYERNFALIQIDVDLGMGRTRQDPAYRLTRDGFSLLAMGFTGSEALHWKITYLDTFNKMEAELSGNAGLLPQTITPSQAQHLRELVQLVVETGKQSHGETWNRLHHKMKVNSYLKLRPEQFDAATAYLRGKMDDASIAAIAAKHFPQLAAPAPQQAIPSPEVTPTQVADMVDHRALLAMSYSIQLRLFEIASNNQDRGPGYDMASKIKDLSPADLYVVNVAASQEVWLRTLHRKQA